MRIDKHLEPPATGELFFEPPLVPLEAPDEYRRFWELWQAEKFFACHEALEELWRRTAGPGRLFYNGLINCAVAIYQHRRGNPAGAVRQLVRAQEKLRCFRPHYKDVDVDALLAGVAQAVQRSFDILSDGQKAQLPALRQELRKRIAQERIAQDFSYDISEEQ